MCRLFALDAGREPVRGTFWLLEAEDSLARQSRANPDGYGIATFEPDGTPDVDKRPAAAYEDERFAREAREERSRTFLAHVRYATSGRRDLRNTHPFEQRGRVFAHNGLVGGLDRLDAQLGPYRELVQGETDSERFFALVTQQVDEHRGDVGAGLAAAARWVAAELPLFALNVLLAVDEEVWALRYPDAHTLLVLEREAGGPSGERSMDAASPAGTLRMRAGDLARTPAVVFASVRMDEDPGWRPLASGELVHVDAALRVTSTLAVDHEPAHRLTLADLDPRAAASQQALPVS
jgi:predicted glutamine amidotransferase